MIGEGMMATDIIGLSARADFPGNDNINFDAASWVGPDNCYVYLMSADAVVTRDDTATALVKVGISSNPWARLSTIQTASPFRVRLAACWRMFCRDDALWVEKTFHRRQRNQRTNGEWFRFDIVPAEWHVAMTVVEWYVEHAVRNFGGCIEFLKFSGMDEAKAHSYLQEGYGDIGEGE